MEERGIVDGLCRCGDPQRRHAKRYAQHHGKCRVAGCRCPQFTWAGWIKRSAAAAARRRTRRA